MSENHHPDPFAEALTLSGQRMVQLITVTAALKQGHDALTRRMNKARQARDDAAVRREDTALRAMRDEARARWAPAHDREWLQQADLYETGRSWAAANPYIDSLTSARSAADKCEARLRELHPYAMQRYDELRAEGRERLEAMRESAPFFTRAPHSRPGDPPIPRAALSEGDGATWAANPHGPTRTDLEAVRQRERARDIADTLRSKAGEKGHVPSPIELRTMLEVATNLPENVIAEAVPLHSERRAGSGIDTPEAALSDTAFPFTIDEVLAMPTAVPNGRPTNDRHSAQISERTRQLNH
ncbi:hypothetical protein [Actinomadura harenae]|uniref:Uncharacterized protein n=1 Tax=Actinomadura harenae TaxID=2483351 RepID=A0A3M2M2P9_9ACTN|nr:hypothetical protein [Actinomadura harenae]RMI43911.1 hypothetical protein EBO15_14505 [Actinomadura harenae]